VPKDKSRNRGDWKHVDGGYAFVIPYTLIRHEKCRFVSAHCWKLLLDLGAQYSGFNNGYLCPAWELMRERGWRSRETLALAVAEALHHRFIERTRQGGRNRPHLYAFTWWPIHAKDGNDLDIGPSVKPNNAWKETAEVFEIPDAIRDRRRRKPSKELHARRAA
jgi:hypothetical protein